MFPLLEVFGLHADAILASRTLLCISRSHICLGDLRWLLLATPLLRIWSGKIGSSLYHRGRLKDLLKVGLIEMARA